MALTNPLHCISYTTHAFTRTAAMFQVASHPVSFDTSSSMRGHARYEQMPVSAHSASSNKISLPRTLSRPQFTEVSSRAMAAASPDLANVPAEYVRRGLREKASS